MRIVTPPRPAHALPGDLSPRALRRSLLAGGIGAVALLAAGCIGMPPLDLIAPKVSVSDVGIDRVGLSEVALTVTLEVENPNTVDIPLTDLRADLELMGRPFGSGWSREVSVPVPARGRRDVPMLITVPTSRLFDLVRAFRLADLQKLGYRLAGSARWGESGVRIPFERAGDLQALYKALEGLGPLVR